MISLVILLNTLQMHLVFVFICHADGKLTSGEFLLFFLMECGDLPGGSSAKFRLITSGSLK